MFNSCAVKYVFLIFTIAFANTITFSMQPLAKIKKSPSGLYTKQVVSLPCELWVGIIDWLVYSTLSSYKRADKCIVESLLNLCTVNKKLYDMVVVPKVWQHVFHNYYRAHTTLFFRKIAQSSLPAQSPIGSYFYDFILSPPYVKQVLSNTTVRNVIGLIAPFNKNEFKFDIQVATHGLSSSTVFMLGLFFKACSVQNKNFALLEKLYTKNSLATKSYNTHNAAIGKWAEYIIKNISCISRVVTNNCTMRLCCEGGYSIRFNDYKGIDLDTLMLAHYLIGYLIKDTILHRTYDKFGQNELIQACRRGDSQLVKFLLTTDQNHQYYQNTILSQTDILGLNAVDIAILDSNNEILDTLLTSLKILLKVPNDDIDTLLHVAVQCNNTYCVKELLKFYSPIAWYTFPHRAAAIDKAFMIALATPNANTKILEMLLDKGAKAFISAKDVLEYVKTVDKFKCNYLSNHYKRTI